jgi:hypothetical protein
MNWHRSHQLFFTLHYVCCGCIKHRSNHANKQTVSMYQVYFFDLEPNFFCSWCPTQPSNHQSRYHVTHNLMLANLHQVLHLWYKVINFMFKKLGDQINRSTDMILSSTEYNISPFFLGSIQSFTLRITRCDFWYCCLDGSIWHSIR